MKSIFLLSSVLGAVSYASECQADEHSLLQARKLVRTAMTMGSKDSKDMLQNMRDVAESLLDGSDTTMSPDDVNEALDAASALLAELSPDILQQIENAQRQIDDAASGFQVCHAQSDAELRSSLLFSTGQRAAAVETCHNTLDQLRTAETQQCNIAEDCLCDEARVRTTDQEPLCASITETYEVAFCEHHLACTIFHQCHSQETEVYQRLRADVEAEMDLTVQEFISVEQSRCLTGLIMEAMTPPRTPISYAALIACDDVDVSALVINFPDLPSEPAACPAYTHGDPQCLGTDRPGPPVATYEGQECCSASGQCDQSVAAPGAAYVSFASCQQTCARRYDCIGIEFGNIGERCESEDSCNCHLITGSCTSQQSHTGYNIWINDVAPVAIATYQSQWCCSAGGDCDQSETTPGGRRRSSRRRRATYVSFASCQQRCAARYDCIGIEFGNIGERCENEDSCKCYLITGSCTSQQSHTGYNIVINDVAPVAIATYRNHQCCSASGDCDQSVAAPGATYVSFASCQQSCAGRSDCIGIEFGNFGEKCQREDSCKCYLVTGSCTSPQSHTGYNILIN